MSLPRVRYCAHRHLGFRIISSHVEVLELRVLELRTLMVVEPCASAADSHTELCLAQRDLPRLHATTSPLLALLAGEVKSE